MKLRVVAPRQRVGTSATLAASKATALSNQQQSRKITTQQAPAKKTEKTVEVKPTVKGGEVEVRRPSRERRAWDPFEMMDVGFLDPRRMFDPFPQFGRLFRDPFFRDFTDPTRELRDLSRIRFPTPLPVSDIVEWAPKIDVASDKDNFLITAEVPGVPKESVKVEIEGDTLTIRGEKKSEHVEEDPDKKVYRRETSYGSFVRSFTLPDGVDPKSVKASFDHGVLKLVVPKSDVQKKESIAVPIETTTTSQSVNAAEASSAGAQSQK